MNLKLSHKIPLAITTATLLSSGTMTYMAVGRLQQYAESQISGSMQDKLKSKELLIKGLMDKIIGDLHALADNPTIMQAAIEFPAAFAEYGPEATEKLHDLYITKNPNELGKKHLLDSANDGTTYSQLHSKYHGYLREFLEEHGYYDIFIVDTQGNVAYTVFKELDFASNLLNGQWKDTDLAKVYKNIMAQESAEDVSFVDFAPYAPSNNVPAAFIGRPIEDESGKRLGALIYQMPIEKMNAIFNDLSGLGETGKVMLIGDDRLLRNDVRFAKESTILKLKADNPQVTDALAGNGGVTLDATDFNGTPVISAYENFKFKGANYALVAEMNQDEMMAPVVEKRNQFLMFAGGFVAIMSLLGVLFARGITNTISRITTAMKKVADGDLQVEVPGLNRKDEIGSMASALQVFKENAQAVEQMRKNEELQKKAAEEQKKAAIRELATKFEQSVKGVVDMVASAATEMDATSRSMHNMAENNMHKLESLNSQIGGTSKNVQMVSSATSQLSAAINEISGQVARATTITQAAVEEAKRTDETVHGLTDASQKIGEVIEMINSIAAQINLLALNATIEAARAGEAGKGFAVVASEVKNLASQTTKATEQIAAYISSIQGATGDTVTAINSISSKIRDINSISSTIAAAVEEQGAATRDIASNVQQAASGTEEVARNAGDVSTSSAQTGTAAKEMNAATTELSRQTEILRREVDSFLVGIRQG